jgi:cytochrome c oxidase cbb3-type subunit 2
MKMTFKTVVIGGLIVFLAVLIAAVFIPKYVWNPPQTVIAHEYTPVQERGREIFYSNGCNYCHTQYVREEDTGMGPVSQGGDYTFDNPMILGSERTGPDLSYIGRKRSEAWEIEHWKDPRKLSPLSIMPSFEFLSEQDLIDLAAYIFNLGDRTAAEWMVLPPETYTKSQDPFVIPSSQPSNDQPQGWSTWNAAELQAGKELYVERCLTCHGCAGNGLGSYAGTLIVTPANYKQEPFRNMPDDQWFWHVSEGVQGTVMPPWKESMTEDQRWQVIRYIQEIFARPSMHDPDEGDPPADYADLTNPVELTVEVLDEGKQIFIRECMVCHGDAGRGNGPYIQGLQPSPPDFGDGSYGDFTDADYFWRISEGLPWSAMPSWKIEYNEADRWKLVHYLKSVFTQTQHMPPQPDSQHGFEFPEVYKDLSLPETATFEHGKKVFLEQCSHCHGLAGDGAGWDGQYLNPTPADFRAMAGMTMGPNAQGEHLAKVTFGIKDTAMPIWGEFLPESQRWDAVKYLMGAFMMGKPANLSVYDENHIAANFLTLSKDNWVGEGNSVSSDHGKELYGSYCATCHGADGSGNGPGTQGNASGSPAPFPEGMRENYIFWRTWDGVPDSVMYPFQWLLSEGDIWDLTVYVQDLTASDGGGGS